MAHFVLPVICKQNVIYCTDDFYCLLKDCKYCVSPAHVTAYSFSPFYTALYIRQVLQNCVIFVKVVQYMTFNFLFFYFKYTVTLKHWLGILIHVNKSQLCQFYQIVLYKF